MISKSKKYFTFFGILAATVDRKIHSFYCTVNAILSTDLPKITKLLLSKQLKPIKINLTNHI